MPFGPPQQGYPAALYGGKPQGGPPQPSYPGQPPYPGQQPYPGQPVFPASQGGYQPYPANVAYPPQAPVISQDVMTWFRAADRDGSGTINVLELNQALTTAGSVFSLCTAERLFSMFDKNFDGRIDMSEFQELYSFIQRMQAGFSRRDTDRTGRLEGPEVRAALLDSGYQLSEHTFQSIMHKFDRNKGGGLSFGDYIEISLFISKARDTFARYDQNRTGTVTLDFDSFIGASLNVL